MTITVYAELEQGSEAWLAARCGLLTASTIGRLITPSTLKVASNDYSRDVIRTLAAERITGHVEHVYPSLDMQRGSLDEPLARDMYSRLYSPVTEIGFAVREIDGFRLGGSPDGLVGEDGGIEIKSRKPAHQLKAFITDQVPAENVAQIQALMLILDRQWWDYCSYAGGWPLFVKRVYPDPRWQVAIRAALIAFETEVENIIGNFKARWGDAEAAPRIDHIAEPEMTF